MKAVVLRCPNCGTVQPERGECEACHEAETRYFCPNHAPGRWLEEPACAECGARVGVVPGPAGRTTPGARPPSRSVEWGPPPERTRDTSAPPPFRVPSRTIHPPTPRAEEPEWVMVDPSDAARVVARGAMGCVGRLVMTIVILAVIAVLLVGGFLGGLLGAAGDAGAAYAQGTAQHVPGSTSGANAIRSG